MVPEPAVLPSSVIADRYLIEREIGSGGMATVYRAIDLKHSRPVAIKVVRPELRMIIGVDRFIREIQVLASLSHPHIVPLVDSGSADGVPFYVMPLIEGETLRQRLDREAQLPVEEALHITRQLADGLGYAHARGVIHRDIKPENILLADGHALLADFGVAYAVSQAGSERITSSGLAIGSPMYMSPEQGSGHGRIDARADLYGLGCVVYEMLTGGPPFTGSSSQAILARHACDSVAPIHTVRSTVPPHVEQAIMQLLAKSPADRIPTASALVRALDSPASVAPRRKWVRPGLLAALTGLGLVAGLMVFRLRPSSPTQRDWLMVADFAGPADDSTLSTAVRELVTVELDQSTSFSTMPRQQVATALQAAGFTDSSRITPEVARELAYRSSVRAVVTGSILPVGDRSYSIVVRALSSEDGSEIASVAGSATSETLIRSVDELAGRLRRRLGERRSAIVANRPLEQVVTPSFPAYRRFVQGRDRIYAGDFAGGNRLLHEAVGIDSSFSAAWAALGTSHVYGRNLDSARMAYSHALAFPERLTETQRFRVEADAAYALRHDLPAAISWYDLYLSQNPHSMAARNNRGLFLSSLGRHEEALDEFRRALEVNPFGPEQVQIERLNEAAELVVLGRIREADAAARDLKGPFADYFAVLRPAALSDWVAAESTATRISALEGSPNFLRIQAITTRAAAKVAQGAVLEGDALLRAAGDRAAGEELRWYLQARLLLAVAAGLLPKPVPAALARDTSVEGWVLHAIWAAARSDSAAAVRALEQARRWPEDLSRLGAGPRLARGWVEAHSGRWRAVLDSLAPVASYGEHDATMLDRVSSFPVRWLVAEAYARIGRLDSAAVYMELLLTPTHMAPGHLALRGFLYPFAHRRLSRWYAALGDREREAAHWKRFSESMTKPDPGLRGLLVQASSSRAVP
jgi:serine/threonine protein kinase/tetratricopeptide (TPR) repeat protein